LIGDNLIEYPTQKLNLHFDLMKEIIDFIKFQLRVYLNSNLNKKLFLVKELTYRLFLIEKLTTKNPSQKAELSIQRSMV
jgi:hypothetical protein